MADRFAGLMPSEYDYWRESAEFFGIENAVVAPMLGQQRAERVLDLGCGTGTWTRKVAEMLPRSEVLGIDSSEDMVEYARKVSDSRIRYLVGDCCNLVLPGRFDLIVCAMSADYIGFQCLRRTIVSALAKTGNAFWWVLDPTSYEIRHGQRLKRWVVNGHTVHAAAAVFDPALVSKEFEEAGLKSKSGWHDVRLSDGKPRRLIVSALDWNHLK